MIAYFNTMPEEEQVELTHVIQTLLRQTFCLERKYDKHTERFVFNREYRTLSQHFEFLEEYFQVAGIQIQENIQSGVIYITGEQITPERLTKISTIFLLVLKLIYDEQMALASASVNIFTTLGEVNEKIWSFQILKDRPSPTEIRRTLAFLKRYQMIEVLDPPDEAKSKTRLIIYPSISMALMGEQARILLESFMEEDQDATGEV